MMHRPTRSARRRRGFTLLETVLSALLGALVVIAAYGLLSAMRDTERRTQVRDFDTTELSRLQRTLRKAVGQIVIAGISGGGQASTQTTAIEQPDPTDLVAVEAAEAKKTKTINPRVLLEVDPQSGAQRVEMVVAEPPALGGADGRLLEWDPGKRFSVTRGAFTLRPSQQDTLPRELWTVAQTTPSFDLWWLPIDLGEEGITAVGLQPGEANGSRGVLIARGLAYCRWRMFKTDETGTLKPLTSARVVYRSDIPAYVEVEAATIMGRKVQWMFEVGFSVIAEDKLKTTLSTTIDENPARTSTPLKKGSGGS